MHKFTNSIDVAARMLVVSSFLVLMPCWAAFWSDNRGEEGQPRDVAKIVSGPALASARSHALCELPGHDRISPPTAGHSEGSPPTGILAPPISPPDQTLVGLQGRLQELGAGYMLLERCRDPQGGVEGSYHFICQIPIPGNPLYQRTFEAVDGEAVAAMRHVLREVELWQAKCSPRGRTR